MYGHESKVPELLGQTLLEGMACGALAICTAVASMPEVVTDGETGFVVPPNDPAAMRAGWNGSAIIPRPSPGSARPDDSGYCKPSHGRRSSDTV